MKMLEQIEKNIFGRKPEVLYLLLYHTSQEQEVYIFGLSRLNTVACCIFDFR